MRWLKLLSPCHQSIASLMLSLCDSLKSLFNVLSPVIANVANVSLECSCFPEKYKQAIMCPILKKPSMDGPMSSEVRSPCVKVEFCVENCSDTCSQLIQCRHRSVQMPARQSAYRQFHSTDGQLQLSTMTLFWQLISNSYQ